MNLINRLAAITEEDLKNRFIYHKPTENKTDVYVAIRAMGYEMATYIVNNAPDCRETSLAITKLEEVVMWANAGISRSK